MKKQRRKCHATGHAIQRYREIDLNVTHSEELVVRECIEGCWDRGVVVHSVVSKNTIFTHVESGGMVFIGARDRRGQWKLELDRVVTVITLDMYRANRAVKAAYRIAGLSEDGYQVHFKQDKKRKRRHRTRRRWAIDGPDVSKEIEG